MQRFITNSYLKLVIGSTDEVALGKCYHYGWHVPRDYQLAERFYRSAALKGNPEAFNQLSLLSHELGKTEVAQFYTAMQHEFERKYDIAIKEYINLANHPEALKRLVFIYKEIRSSNWKGHQDLSDSIITFLKDSASDGIKHSIQILSDLSQDDPRVATQFANMYEAGEVGGAVEITKAIPYYIYGATQHNADALNKLETHQHILTPIELIKLSVIYLDVFKNKFKALRILIKLHCENNSSTRYLIDRCVRENGRCLLTIPKLYEEFNNVEIAIQYYLKFARDKTYNVDQEKCIDALLRLHERLSAAEKLELAKFLEDRNLPLTATKLYRTIAGENKQALMQMKRLAAADVSCSIVLAQYYIVKKKFASAYSYYIRAAHSQNADGIEFLGVLRARANENDAVAQYYLGKHYELNQDELQTVRWIFSAAELGYAPAVKFIQEKPLTDDGHYYLGTLFLQVNKIDLAIDRFGHVLKSGYVQAKTEISELAQNGNARAQFLKAKFDTDAYSALDNLVLSAEQGHVPAQENIAKQSHPENLIYIATKYKDGKGIQQNLEKAVQFYEKAAALNHVPAMISLAEIYIENEAVTAMKYYSRAASLGSSEALKTLTEYAEGGMPLAQYLLGAEYYLSHKEYLTAVTWVVRATNLRFEPAVKFLEKTKFTADVYCHIADLFIQGKIVSSNKNISIYFYNKAVKAGDNNAPLILANMYLETGIKQDVHTACNYLEIAATKNNNQAIIKLEELANSGLPEAQYSYSQYLHHAQSRFSAVDWALKAARQNYALAIHYLENTIFPAPMYTHLANRYAENFHEKSEIQSAIKFYLKAMQLQDIDAALNLGHLFLANNEFDPDKTKAFECFFQAAEFGDSEALITLESFADELTPNLQMALGELYQNLSNEVKSLYWLQRASDAGLPKAKSSLNNLSVKLRG